MATAIMKQKEVPEMNVARTIVTICMCDNKCLKTRKVFLCKIETKGLCTFTGKITFRCVSRIKIDDKMIHKMDYHQQV